LALQQVELDEARQVAQIDVALAPDALELRLVAQLHLEPVHGNEHDCLFRVDHWRSASVHDDIGTMCFTEYRPTRAALWTRLVTSSWK